MIEAGTSRPAASERPAGSKETLRSGSGGLELLYKSFRVEDSYKDSGQRSTWSPEATEEFAIGSSTSRMSLSSTASFTAPTTSSIRLRSAHLLKSRQFDFMIGLVIFLNAGTIGIQQQQSLDGYSSWYVEALEHFFLCVYIAELSLRLFAWGFRKCARDAWVRFDFMLVVIGIVSQWILGPIALSSDLSPVMVLRMARLLRLARAAKLLIKFQELYMLIRGFMSSANLMLYTLLLLFLILYVFSAVGVELITNHKLARGPEADADFADLVNEFFPSLWATMLTLMQFVTQDSIHAIYVPLVRKDWTLLFYFVGIIVVIPIVLMNLITGVIVNSALEQASQDKEARHVMETKRRKKIVAELRDMFGRLDRNNNGTLTHDELMTACAEDRNLLVQFTTLDDPMSIFKTLDVDGSGEVGIDEFCDGILEVVTSDRPIELKRMGKQLNFIIERMNDMRKVQVKLQANQNAMIGKVDHICKELFEFPVKGEEDQLTSSPPAESIRRPCSNQVDQVPSWARDLVEEVRRLPATLAAAMDECTSDARGARASSRHVHRNVCSNGGQPENEQVGLVACAAATEALRHRSARMSTSGLSVLAVPAVLPAPEAPDASLTCLPPEYPRASTPSIAPGLDGHMREPPTPGTKRSTWPALPEGPSCSTSPAAVAPACGSGPACAIKGDAVAVRIAAHGAAADMSATCSHIRVPGTGGTPSRACDDAAV
eukprot:TRINITY_DN27064_c0_g1_i1.p1 TRINITY_DN27064_c0_g1~~TRINITY_DN27064_c0_g1_i1.p1  ORF type:complete len:715 (+),score=131.71 TRINITY_DN27064_c0_g1_i1:93-2237(+)